MVEKWLGGMNGSGLVLLIGNLTSSRDFGYLLNTLKPLPKRVLLFVLFDSLRTINNLSVIKGRVFLG